uniref:Orf407 n=1 Tax=Dichelobacter nodosus TaxID=870 RepID=Q5I711_DICNO|nr:Orf407 [Dichelobacter nodosus]
MRTDKISSNNQKAPITGALIMGCNNIHYAVTALIGCTLSAQCGLTRESAYPACALNQKEAECLLNAFSNFTATSGLIARFPLIISDNAERGISSFSAVSVTLRPKGSKYIILSINPGCGGFFIFVISRSLVIIHIINNISIAIFKFEDNTPITINFQAPMRFKLAFQLMQFSTFNIQFFDILRKIYCVQQNAQFCRMMRLNTANIILFKESFQAFMGKRFNHWNVIRENAIVTRRVTQIKNHIFPLTSPKQFIDNTRIAATPAVEIRLSFITKRIALFQRYFYAQILSICYGGVRGRTFGFAVFFVSGKANLAYTVALFCLNGGSQSSITKETAMSNISIQLSVDESQELSLYRDALLESLYEAELDIYHLSRQHKLALLELVAAINQAQTYFDDPKNAAQTAVLEG